MKPMTAGVADSVTVYLVDPASLTCETCRVELGSRSDFLLST
jgi:hypothetical protein